MRCRTYKSEPVSIRLLLPVPVADTVRVFCGAGPGLVSPPRPPPVRTACVCLADARGGAAWRGGCGDLRLPGGDRPTHVAHHQHLLLQQGDLPAGAHLQRLRREPGPCWPLRGRSPSSAGRGSGEADVPLGVLRERPGAWAACEASGAGGGRWLFEEGDRGKRHPLP